MNETQIRELLSQYESVLLGAGARPQEDLVSRVGLDAQGQETMENHALSMILKMYGMLDHLDRSTREKLMRWLGFLQGTLWGLGIYSINDLRDHNRSGL